jgi:hypothetical protein
MPETLIAERFIERPESHRSPVEVVKVQLFELYLRRMDRIDDWDLVDLGAWDVVGRYLIDRPRGTVCAIRSNTSTRSSEPTTSP